MDPYDMTLYYAKAIGGELRSEEQKIRQVTLVAEDSGLDYY